ncbi:hypothetical protein [Adhaeretor mobilis]|uniref:Uncharacterized protein n=1 Tax=Adhaeretor mobilis TaxID=1930276 RepID=A0A517MWW1_9BACT|nr:hypothetical protein [Adhaeretor mobilis]QDS99363.1 hypothetical protein HG15A2_26860 [Adhaeretor mobilis]
MNDSLIRKFCETGYRWPIVATATLLIGLVTLLPLADDYSERSEACSVLTEELDRARQKVEALPKFEERVAALSTELTALESRAVTAERVGDFRSRIIELARESNCQLRRIDIGTPNSRIWTKEGDVLSTQSVPKSAKNKTPFQIVRRSMVLAVDGEIADLKNLIAKFQEENTLAHPARLSMSSSGRASDRIAMEVELWVYDLTRKKS